MKGGSRLRENYVKVCHKSNGQFMTTIPKGIADQQGLNKGSVLEFEYFTLDEIKGLSVQDKLFDL